MGNYDAKGLIDLDECVLNALHLFIDEGLPKLHLGNFKRPLVVGSGNAAATGRILLEDTDAVEADESNFEKKLGSVHGVDGAILISASGEKHAPIIAKVLKKRKIKTILLTCNKNASAVKFVSKAYILPKNAEPYTYNTSTYMGMIMGHTRESPKKILEHIKKKIKPKIPKNLSKYNAFFILVPNKFGNIREMFATKFDELFSSMVNGRVFTEEQVKHAKTITPSGRELFIGIGCENKVWGGKRANFKLPKGAKHAAVMAIGYYIIGQIQKQNPPYFKRNIAAYTKNASKIFGAEIKSIIE